jgi:hypothetical protein
MTIQPWRVSSHCLNLNGFSVVGYIRPDSRPILTYLITSSGSTIANDDTAQPGVRVQWILNNPHLTNLFTNPG